ncbi:MAG: AAA family ATPase [Nannocystaceae bacterium]
MHLRRIQIPEFRVLRDVDLRFDAGMDPQVFPLGSENGGGKSTLLQLVFVLLHCTSEPEQAELVRNTMSSFDHPAGMAEKLVARLDVWDGDRQRSLEFVSLGNALLVELVGSHQPGMGFEVLEMLSAEQWNRKHDERLSTRRDRITHGLAARNYLQVTWYPAITDEDARHLLIVRGWETDGTDMETSEVAELLARCRRSVFLMGPSSQPYLFLPLASRQSFVVRPTIRSNKYGGARDEPTGSPLIAYLRDLEHAAERLPGFFAYDWVSVDPLVELFKQARDRDFASAVEQGSYGTALAEITRNVNALLFGKQVRPLGDLSGVEFTVTQADGTERKLGPEDLSRGELKRLMLYAWLRTNADDDALVLMDELEVSFHPDWQYGIVRDLVEWAPRAQFVLATHSHEICEAVTPAHVRELEPKLGSRVDDGTST